MESISFIMKCYIKQHKSFSFGPIIDQNVQEKIKTERSEKGIDRIERQRSDFWKEEN